MSALGRLVASVVLDTAEFTGGTEKAKYQAAQMAGEIDRGMRDLERNIKGTMGGIAAAVAAGFSVAAFKSAFDGYTEGAAKLLDLAGKAGTTVEKMSAMTTAAKLSGTAIDEVAAAMEKLAKGVVNAGKETGSAGDALKFLGVNARDANGNLKDSGTLTEEIALKLAGYRDGVAKTTLAMDLYGKAGANLIPFLKDLAEYGAKDAKITEQQARLAKEYTEDLVRLTMAKDGLMKIISKELLPVADAFVKTLLEMQTKSGGVRDEVKKLADDGSIRTFAEGGVRLFALVMNAGDGVVRTVKVVGETIGYLAAVATEKVTSFAQTAAALARGDMIGAGASMLESNARQLQMQKDYAQELEAIVNAPMAGDSFYATFEQKLAAIDTALLKVADKTGKSADGYKAAAAAARDLTNESDRLIATLTKELDKVSGLSFGHETLARVMVDIERLKKQGKVVDEETIKSLAEQIDAQIKYNNELRAYNAILDELDAHEQAKIERSRQIIESIEDANQKIAFENGLIGQSAAAIALANVQRERELALRGQTSQIAINRINQLYDEKAALVAQGTVLREQVSLWGQIGDRAGAFFADLVMNGRSAFDRLRDSLKSFAADLIAIFAKQWVLNIAASMTGSAALGSAAASVGANSIGGSALNLLGLSGAGSSLGSLIGGGAGVAAPGMGLTAGIESALIGSGNGMLAGLGASGAIGMIGTALPYIGAAIAIYSMFANKGGGPKDGGSFFGQYTSLGDYIGQGRVPGTDNGRFFTPNGQDGYIAGIGQGAGSQYYATARALGLGTGAFSFGLGFDTDPKGTAPNRVSSSLVDASGNTLYGSRDRDIGRDSAAIAPALQLEASRMVLAAIKSSDMPAYLKKVFDSVVTDSASQADIDNVIKKATAFKSIFDVVTRNPLEDVAKAVSASQNQYTAAMQANESSIRAVMKSFDGTAASAQTLATATTTYYNAQLQLMVALRQTSDQINGMFDQTFRNIRLAGMDKQGQYNFYQQDAEQARQLLKTATDPETIRQLSARINQDINAAFGLLSPEQQKAMSAQFIEQGKQAQKEANDRIEKIQKDAAEQTNKTLKEIKELIGAGAEDQKSAAKTQLEAAQINSATAKQPVTVQLVDSRGNVIVNGGRR